MRLLRADRKVFDFIGSYLDRNGGICPSYREIMAGVGSKSLGHTAQIVTKLERSGYIRKLPNKRRAIEIVRTPMRNQPDVVLPLDVGQPPQSLKRATLVGVRLK